VGQRTFFSIELCFALSTSAAAHAELRAALARSTGAKTPRAQWQLLRTTTDVMARNLKDAVYGCWEYFDDEQAESMYDDWLKPLQDPSRRPKPSTLDPVGRYFTSTICLQPIKGSGTDMDLAAACRVSQPQLWKRATFQRILAALPKVSFASVARDAFYLMPQVADGHGFTRAELDSPAREYLRPLD
jgi:hypothetical protein